MKGNNMPNAITNAGTMCNGCPRNRGWVATGWICSVYPEPTKTYGARNGTYCPFNPPSQESAKKKKVNPIKASKRGGK